MKVFADLKARGCQDILIAVTDGLKSMREALAAAVPDRRRRVAPRLGPGDSVLCVSARDSPVIYTTNALESVHAQLRKIIRTRGHFPNDDAATKLEAIS